jgi:uncharacterized membrane protein (DUF373 family)
VTDRIEALATASEDVMRWLELGAAYFLVALFAIGVFDLGLSLYDLLISGRFTDPDAVIDLIDTVLVLLIIVEVYQTVIAFSRDEPVTRIVITAALIAIARKVISFRPDEFASTEEALLSAITFSILLAVLIAGFFVVRQVDRPGIPGLDRESANRPESRSDRQSEAGTGSE